MRSAIIENGVVTNVILGSLPGSVESDTAQIGDLYDGQSFSKPLPNIPALKAAKNTEINLARGAANTSTFPYGGKTFACDQLSRSDIDGINGYVAIYSALPAGWPGAWKAVDNSYSLIPDVATWKLFYAAMVATGNANFAHAQTLKTQLAAATTASEIAAVQW